MKEITTKYISNQRYYVLPDEVGLVIKKVEVYNQKKKTWESKGFSLVLQLNSKKRKTDQIIKVYL